MLLQRPANTGPTSGCYGRLRILLTVFVCCLCAILVGNASVCAAAKASKSRTKGYYSDDFHHQQQDTNRHHARAGNMSLVHRARVHVPERDNEFFAKGKICIGTNGRMSVPSNRDHHYRNLKDRFTNCTYVDGNLELTWLQDENLDLSFLQYIREVTGYVLISHVDIKRIVLPRLQIIRGRTLFKINNRNDTFALMVTFSKMYSLELPALRDVLSGSIGLFNNYNLCHVKTINWKEIITDPQGHYEFVYSFTSPERDCPACHKNCEAGCWGEGEENCQKFSKENCSPQCFQGRCFGSNPRECCHLFCAGGCTGPKQSDCIACRNFYDDGVCTQECPPMQIYNPTTYSWEPNPNGKYAYGATCVKNCPEHLLKDSGACVRTCPPSRKAVNGECLLCDGPCPKTCAGDVTINAFNIDTFKGCTIIDGYIHILENSFHGYQQIFANYSFGKRIPDMHPDRLEVFSTLKEITGFIDIQANHSQFRNLSYFRNLEVIGGRTHYDYFSALFIVKTSLQSLELKSLKKINSGTVVILENTNLCFAENVNWTKIKKSEAANIISNNTPKANCSASGLVCDAQCGRDGCWGSGPDQCLACALYRFEGTCLQNCSTFPGIYRAENNECKKCHDQCGHSCKGPGADNCTTCKYFKDGPFCVSKCPSAKYEEDALCKPCHDICVDGCTGNGKHFGAGGCNSCDKAIMNDTITMCLEKNEPCPDGYFYESVHNQEESLKALIGKAICRKCHPRCKICSGYGFHESICQQCASYKRGEQCEDECPGDHYADNNDQLCIECDVECRGCVGPANTNCLACHNLKTYVDGTISNTSAFACTSICPPAYPHRSYHAESSETICAENQPSANRYQPNKMSTAMTSIVIFIGILITSIVIFAIVHICKRAQVKENAMKMTRALTGLEDVEPLRVSNMPPNLARLRIIKEAEMRRGGILGYGAFGTVYKGVWVPEAESSKIPVAIKVLREDTGANTSKEFLGEAYIMASVEHPNLLQLLAVCMTSQMMLVTQLMPLGCLLDFVRKNQEKIGSKPMLTWCTQIARGMAYLEEKRLVHRDLAARNVLVQSPACVKITDFGLAKLLDINEEEYKAAGGKMPIKWLALECIQHRIFTHKSDVWAFGVTVWELLTYGGRPYDNVPARNVPELLENGERLPQPKICSIDVYMIMIKCWMLDAESRPGFKELEDDFTKMGRDPGRYLAITGDKHMRLQNFPASQEDTLRNLHSAMDHSQQQQHSLEFDECMQPKSRAPYPTGLSSLSISPTPMRWAGSSQMTSDGSCAPQNQHNWNQERLRYAQAKQAQGAHSDASSIRYCGDSLHQYKPDLNSTDEYDSGSKSSQACVGSVKLELPVDEDDYLVPSPQQTQHAPSTYVELMGDAINADRLVYRNYPDFCNKTQTNIDNPEYLMGDAQTLGIPTLSELVHNNNAPQITPPTPGVAPLAAPQRSSEEESDHEYYNDFDRLQRELQPLHRKGETTV